LIASENGSTIADGQIVHTYKSYLRRHAVTAKWNRDSRANIKTTAAPDRKIGLEIISHVTFRSIRSRRFMKPTLINPSRAVEPH